MKNVFTKRFAVAIVSIVMLVAMSFSMVGCTETRTTITVGNESHTVITDRDGTVTAEYVTYRLR